MYIMTYSDCCPKKRTYSCYTPCYQKTNYCDCYSCKPKCHKEEKCCIKIDYSGLIMDSGLTNLPSGLYLKLLANGTCSLHKSDASSGVLKNVRPSKQCTKFLDCNTKDLYKLTLEDTTIKCTKIKTVSKDDCIELLCTDTIDISP